MMKKTSFVLTLVFVGFVLLFTVPVYAQNWKPSLSDPTTPYTTDENVTVDILFLRPAGVISCAVGLIGSVFAFPFALTSGSESTVYKEFIAKPFSFTFTRPIGSMDDIKDTR